MTIFARIRRIEARLVTGMAYFCGALFLLLAFYTTYDVIARRYGGWYSGVTDEMSEYALALAASWSLAYTLRAGGHVRVDIVLPYLPGTVRRLLDAFAMAVMAVFAATASVYLWKLVGSSYAIGATGHSIIQTPQWLPQAMMASGYSLLAAVAFTSCIGHFLGGDESAAQPND